MTRHFVILNPAAGRRRRADRLVRYQSLLHRRLDAPVLAQTGSPGDEGRLVARALAEDYDVVAAAGGDGTLGRVAHALALSGRRDVAMGVLPNGTGNDFVRNLGMDPNDPDGAVRTLARGKVREVDLGRIESASVGDDAESVEGCHFLNLVGFGFDIAVIRAAAKKRWLKGAALYKITALEQLFRFPGCDAAVDRVAERSEERNLNSLRRHLLITISNGTYFGGGFPIAPGASVDDGRLHLCGIPDAGPVARMRLFGLAQKGRHLGVGGVFHHEGDRFRVTSPEPFDFEADGEIRRADGGVVEVRVLPRAIRIVAP